MNKSEKNQRWVFSDEVDGEAVAEGVSRKVLAYCDGLMCVENAFEQGAIGAMHSHPHTQITYVASGAFSFTIGDVTKVVRKGDAMLKQDEVMHGCVCIEPGVLIDMFTPMREDFV